MGRTDDFEAALEERGANEILSSWQYMDVYVLSIVITAWQIGDISYFMLNARYCGSLHETFASLSLWCPRYQGRTMISS